MKRLVLIVVPLVALVVSLCMSVSPTGHAKAQAGAPIDISGDWIFTVLGTGGDPFLDCAATITQAGTDLSMAMDCTLVPEQPGEPFSFHSRDLRGTIDTATGDISMSGNLSGTVGGPKTLALDVRGTASPDGNSMSGSWTNGSWTVDCGDGGQCGTFDGVRQSAATRATTVAVATPAAAVAALPGTGSGGYLDQNSSPLPMVTWLALASASLAMLCLGVGLRRRTRRA